MGSTVVLGQHLADLAWRVGDGAVADLAARDRQLGDSHRKAPELDLLITSVMPPPRDGPATPSSRL
jgi:hypothetical protein